MSHKIALISQDGVSPVSQAAFSDNGTSYTKATSTIHRANTAAIGWSKAAYSPSLGVLIAVANDTAGASLEMMRSTDGGDNWSAVTMPADAPWMGVCWAEELSLFIAVSTSGLVATSPTGVTWTSRTAASASAWQRIAWSKPLGLLLVVGNTTNTMTSPDGITWTGHSGAIGSANWTDLCWCGGSVNKFLAVGGGTNAVATWDGSGAWTNFASFAGSGSNRVGCAWSEDLGKAILTRANTGDITLTSDLATGTIATSQGAAPFPGAAWSHDLSLFVVAGANVVYTSPDGATWTSRTPPTGTLNWSAAVALDAPPLSNPWVSTETTDTFSATGSAISDTANTGFVMVSGNGATGSGAVSDDLVTWTTTSFPKFINGADNTWVGLAYSRRLNRYVAVANSGDNNNNAIATSDDEGATWTGRAVPSGSSWQHEGVTWADTLGLFVVCGVAGPTTTARILTSPDGITWTARDLPDASKSLYSVAWSPELGLFCATGDSNAVYTSPDGVTWTAATTPPSVSKNWRGVVWAGNGHGGGMQKFATAADGTNDLAYSSNGASWSQTTAAGGLAARGLAYSPDRDQIIVYASNSGNVAYTSGGSITSFTSHFFGFGTTAIHAAAWSSTLQLWLGFGGTGATRVAMSSPDGATWTNLPNLAPDLDFNALVATHYDRWVSTEAPDTFAGAGFPIPYTVTYIIDANQDFIVPHYTAIEFELWGGGASGNGLKNTTTAFDNGVAGNDTQIAALSLIAHGAAAVAGGSSASVPQGSAGGTASGGDTNTSGGNGDNGHITAGTSGKGGDAPNGGAGGAAVAETDGAAFQHGLDGAVPGGGGSGVPFEDSTAGLHLDGAGGGAGAYLSKTYLAGITSGRPAVGDVLSLAVAAATLPPTAPGATPGHEFGTSTFGMGAHGRIKISVTYSPIQGPLDATETPDAFVGYFLGWHSTEPPDTFNGTGVVPIIGIWGSTEPVDTLHAIGYMPITGPLAATESPDIFNATGFAGFGAWASTEADDHFDALGIGATPKKRRIFFAT